MSTTIARLKGRVQAARDRFERGRSALHRADGSRVYADAEHAERLGALRGERNRVLLEVREELRAAFASSDAEIANLENRDPTELLTDPELTRAKEKRGFALDAAETLEVDALVRQLEAVLAAGEGASIFAHWMAGLCRRDKILERRREASQGSPGAPTATATELDDALARMHEALDGGRTAAAIEACRGRLEELREVERIAYLAERETNTVYSPQYSTPG